MANELQWTATMVKDEREKAQNALNEHKASTKNLKQKAHKINEKTVILLNTELTEKEVNKRLKKYEKL